MSRKNGRTMTAEAPSLASARPLNDNVLIRIPFTGVTDGGVRLPDSIAKPREKYLVGEVIAVGPGQLTISGERQRMDAREGDQVVVNWHAAEIPEIPGVSDAEDNVIYAFVSERNILGVL